DPLPAPAEETSWSVFEWPYSSHIGAETQIIAGLHSNTSDAPIHSVYIEFLAEQEQTSLDSIYLSISQVASINPTGENTFPLFTLGPWPSSDNIDLYSLGPLVDDSEVDLFIKSPIKVSGGIDPVLPLYIENFPTSGNSNNTIDLFIEGFYDTEILNVPLFIQSRQSGVKDIPLFLDCIQDSSGNLPLYIHGTGHFDLS